jgi:hypothetical protein
MESNTRLGWFINDLSRAAVPYHLTPHLRQTRRRLHRFVQHDGPVSIARAFVPTIGFECALAASLDQARSAFSPSFRPARLCVAGARRNDEPTRNAKTGNVDHLVIGGGPAGAMAAIRLAPQAAMSC